MLPTKKKHPTIYQFGGTPKDLQFSVELSFCGMTFGNLPSFEQFAMQLLPSSVMFDGSVARPQSTTPGPSSGRASDLATVFNFAGGEAEAMHESSELGGAITETRKIHWQEKIEKTYRLGASVVSAPIAPIIVPDDPSHSTVQNESNVENNELNVVKDDANLSTHRVSRIFTYTEPELSLMNQKNSPLSDVKENSQIFRPRRIAPLRPSALKNPVSSNLTLEQRRKRNSVAYVEQTMLVMAYLGNFDDAESEHSRDEHIICQISIVNGSYIKFQPELGTFPVKSRHGTYMATIRVESVLEFDSLIRSIGPDQPAMEDEEFVNNGEQYNFDLPKNQIYWIHYFIMLEQGIDFAHDGLCVEYQVELPPSVDVLQKNSLRGRTQICYVKEDGCHDIMKIGYPIELTICYPTWKRQHNEIVTWPRILFRVTSEDYWKRFYVSGYASVHLPIEPGQHEIKVDCWRVINPYSNVSTFRDFFLGQPVDLKSIESAGSKDGTNRWAKICSKLGLQTESSGSLEMSVHCVHQSRQYISRDVLRSLKYGSLMNIIGISGSMHWRIMKVLNEFEIAKQQLFRLRTMKIPFFTGI